MNYLSSIVVLFFIPFVGFTTPAAEPPPSAIPSPPAEEDVQEESVLRVYPLYSVETPLPYRANNVDFGAFMFMNEGGATLKVEEITFTRNGLGYDDDVQKMFLRVGDQRVTHVKDVRDDKVTLRFLEPYEIPAGDAVQFALYGRMRAFDIVDEVEIPRVGTTFLFTIDSRNDIKSSAVTIEGAFPLTSPTP